jgi:hypothetical protein
VALRTVFEAPTVAELARAVDELLAGLGLEWLARLDAIESLQRDDVAERRAWLDEGSHEDRGP